MNSNKQIFYKFFNKKQIFKLVNEINYIKKNKTKNNVHKLFKKFFSLINIISLSFV